VKTPEAGYPANGLSDQVHFVTLQRLFTPFLFDTGPLPGDDGAGDPLTPIEY
jgi:hypothetical protein